MDSHLKTAHQYGVNEALKKCGYNTAEDVTKEAAALGLFEQPAQPEQPKTATDQVLAALRAKLGG